MKHKKIDQMGGLIAQLTIRIWERLIETISFILIIESNGGLIAQLREVNP